MKKFIGIPNHFKGVSDSSENLIFPAIIDRNACGFITCYKKADELFVRLATVQDKFKVKQKSVLFIKK
jgi:dynein heavy chain 2